MTDVPDWVEIDVRALLDALDRMHGNTRLSMNVQEAYALLRQRFPKRLDPRDRSQNEKSPSAVETA